jgi:hypothetical protein
MDQDGAEPWPERKRNSSRVLSHYPSPNIICIKSFHLNLIPSIRLCVFLFPISNEIERLAAALAALEAGETGADTAADGL